MSTLTLSELQQRDLNPRAVVCVRGNIRQGLTFDAEIAFKGGNFFLSRHKDRESAQNAADTMCAQLIAAMLAAAAPLISPLQPAKE